MKTFKQLAIATAISCVAALPISAHAVNINGVVFEAGAQFITTSLWESTLTTSTGSLSGVGVVNSINNDGGVGITWNNGQNDTQLTYYFSGFAVQTWYDISGGAHIAGDEGSGANSFANAVRIDFKLGTINLYTDSVSGGTLLNPSASGSTPGTDITKATDGALWLSYAGHAFTSNTGRNGTLLSTVDDALTNVHQGGVGTGYLDVVGGVAANNFNTNSWNLGNDGVADAFFKSNFSSTNSGGWPLSGTADIKTTAIPEPASLALVALGLLGAGSLRRRRSA